MLLSAQMRIPNSLFSLLPFVITSSPFISTLLFNHRLKKNQGFCLFSFQCISFQFGGIILTLYLGLFYSQRFRLMKLFLSNLFIYLFLSTHIIHFFESILYKCFYLTYQYYSTSQTKQSNYRLQLCRRQINVLQPPHKNLLNTFELMLIAEHCVMDILFWQFQKNRLEALQ